MTETQEIVITRLFRAPRARVWQAWTEPQHLMQWWGPSTFTVPVCRVDLRVGGRWHYCMRSPQGDDTWAGGTFREVTAPERLVVTDEFTDADGNTVPATTYGMPVDWPADSQIALTFTEQNGQTSMTLRHTGVPAGEMGEMTRAGWNESFDRLAEFLGRP